MHHTLQALQRLVSDAQTLRALPTTPGLLPQHWTKDFFIAAACLDLQVVVVVDRGTAAMQ